MSFLLFFLEVRTFENKLQSTNASTSCDTGNEPLSRAWRIVHIGKVVRLDHAHGLGYGWSGIGVRRRRLDFIGGLCYWFGPNVQGLFVGAFALARILDVGRHCWLPLLAVRIHVRSSEKNVGEDSVDQLFLYLIEVGCPPWLAIWYRR